MTPLVAPLASASPIVGGDASLPSTSDDAVLTDPPQGGLSALCRGPWRRIDESAPFRGVVPEELNTGGQCCPLEGRTFVCVMPGPQHQPQLHEVARFYDGVAPRPRTSIVIHAYENPGMDPPPWAPPVKSVSLEAIEARDGFVLRPVDAGECRRPAPFMTAMTVVCRNAGAYTWKAGVPVRTR